MTFQDIIDRLGEPESTLGGLWSRHVWSFGGGVTVEAHTNALNRRLRDDCAVFCINTYPMCRMEDEGDLRSAQLIRAKIAENKEVSDGVD